MPLSPPPRRSSTRHAVNALLALSVFAIRPDAAWSEPKPAIVELSAAHRRWLEEEVVWIISDLERDTFRNLASDNVRDKFIDAFWTVRDPVPSTRTNEFRIEHEKRVAEANKLFGRTKKKGCKSSRGKIFIQLGPPRDRLSYPMERRLYPIEHWFYQGAAKMGLPPFFSVVFFQPYGGGDWELYDPMIHGPEQLVGGHQESGFSTTNPTDEGNRKAAYEELQSVSPELAFASLSLDPTDPPDVSNIRPSQSSRQLVDRLGNLANRQPVDRKYIDQFLAGDSVEAEYSFRQLGLVASFHGAYTPDGASVVDYAIEFPPSALTLERYQGRITGALQIVGRVFAGAATIPVVQIDERVELSLTADELKRVEASPFAFVDRLPLVPGSYRASLVVRNLVNREFGVVEASFDVPARPTSGIALSPLLLTAVSSAAGDDPRSLPFRHGDRVWYPTQGATIPVEGELSALVQLTYSADRYAFGDEIQVAYSLLPLESGEAVTAGSQRVRLSPVYDRGVAVALLRAPLQDLAPGSRFRLRVIATGKGHDTAEREIVVTTSAVRSPRPWLYVNERRVTAGSLPLELAEQYLQQGDETAALRAYADAFASDRLGAAARQRYAELAMKRKEFAPAVAALEPLTAASARPTYALLLLGMARSGNGDHAGAVEILQTAARESPRSTQVLNLLAEELLLTNDREAAHLALTRSLAVDPEQPRIQELKARLQRQAEPHK